MIILGVDPGTLITGFGIVESRDGRMRMLDCGYVHNAGHEPMPVRLHNIFRALEALIRKYKPDEFAIETAFYGKNAQSALKLGHARGVAMLAAVQKEIPTSEYSPREVKKAIVGTGSASKEQVQFMVRTLLQLKSPPKFYDVTDALAVAICHVQRSHMRRGGKNDWTSFLAAHPERISRPRSR